ncbi:MAG: DJ-1/PfpI family protein [Candidatus Peribacteraceae bacterium]|nr:DJ-1/PfpI family protein [Candidatus Peribacteraceae bacterium]
MRTVLLIIAPEGFQDHELAGTRKSLEDAGFQVILGSTRVGPCTGKFGSTEQATVALENCQVEDYDRIGFIGGPGAESLIDDAAAHALARATITAGKPLGAICIAPLILAKAGVLKGKRAAVWDSRGEQIAEIERHGATFSGEDVTVDGLIVTGNGPGAASRFGKVFAELEPARQ